MVAALPRRPAARGPGIDRARLYGRAVLVAVAIGFVVSVAAGSGSDTVSGRLGGDFPAFYAAGALAGEGAWDVLYDPDAQARAQERLLGGDEDGAYLYFAYPPPVALVYRPLAALPYRLAYVVHTAAMVGFLVGALRMARPMVARLAGLAGHTERAVTASLLAYPVLRAVTGGQNTAATLFLLVLAWRGLHDDRDDLVALALVLSLYKPQFALPLAALVAWHGRWRAVGGAALGGALYWVVGAAAMGPGWVTSWSADVAAFAAHDAEVNAHNAISWLGAAEAVLGAGTTGARVVAAPLIAATAALLALVWRRRSPHDAGARMAVTAAALVLCSPHAMFYDAGVLVITALVAIDRRSPRAAPVVGAAVALSWTHLAAPSLGVAPLFVVVVATAAILGAGLLGDAPRQKGHRRAPISA